MILAPVRHALRALKRTPVFTAAVTLTLVLGVGSITAMFAVAHGVMFKPLPYGSPGRLVSLSLESRIPETRRIAQPASAYFTYQRFNRTLVDIGFYRTGSANITGDDANASERVQATWVTPSTFATLGVPALLGRTFTARRRNPLGGDQRRAAVRVEKRRCQRP